MSAPERVKAVTDGHACFSCLKKAGNDHCTANCKRRRQCPMLTNGEQCTSFHHPLLHAPEVITVSASAVTCSGDRILPILTTNLLGNNGSRSEGNVLLDSGAEISIIRQDMADHLQLTGTDVVVSMTKVRSIEEQCHTKIYSFYVQSQTDQSKIITIRAISLPSISDDVQHINVSDIAVTFSIEPSMLRRKGGKIDLLIGIDYPHLHTGITKRCGNLIARDSMLGWVVFGRTGNTFMLSGRVLHLGRAPVVLTKFWATESKALLFTLVYEGGRDFVRLLPDAKAEQVDKIAQQLGLFKVGWMFTDLIADNLQKGTVKHLRNVDSHFLSAQECIMAGHFQNMHPNPCKMASSGYFGSKFVTVLVTGDKDNQGSHGRLSSEKDSYGNEVTKLARPLPVEYLLIDVPVSTPVEPQFTFNYSAVAKKFPVENRFIDTHIQDFSVLKEYVQQFPADNFLEAASDFHFLLYIAMMDVLPLFGSLGPLLQAVKSKNVDLANQWANEEQWETVKQLLVAQGGSPPQSRPQSADAEMDTSSGNWTCKHCTFINTPDKNTCEICALPQN
ncbi:Nuclear protein localization protein 4 [Nymphon striatum]|nr:Nuclear protein localization protein 4 [Nymphon striatum]